ncbi:hypothetical protein AS9A_P20003 (plasmid) [Hoyosella subflava DQS3-9A1]|uniref:Uncharacterized protein n=1 Tax=Hoyosella subflava (strain DSM 45089 / JCM 17490 / NBRC 109087 / DQS3-9A1) TaxID=443218 RepID=F6ESC6_HOYSD|nr:hypothetical protein AS9A_P20003 [Hoyosella subflava DQS3-9A1]
MRAIQGPDEGLVAKLFHSMMYSWLYSLIESDSVQVVIC